MARINISVPDDLAAQVRELGLPVSGICQAALRNAVKEKHQKQQCPTCGTERAR